MQVFLDGRMMKEHANDTYPKMKEEQNPYRAHLYRKKTNEKQNTKMTQSRTRCCLSHFKGEYKFFYYAHRFQCEDNSNNKVRTDL